MTLLEHYGPDMKFVQNFTPPISPNFNSFSEKKHKKLVKMEKFTPLATNFTLPPGLTGWTNFTSALVLLVSGAQVDSTQKHTVARHLCPRAWSAPRYQARWLPLAWFNTLDDTYWLLQYSVMLQVYNTHWSLLYNIL